MITGIGLAAAPNLLLRTLRIAETDDPWIRVLGVVISLLGYYYITAARADSISFFRATIRARLVVPVAFTILVALQLADPLLIAFGLVDALGAAWTWTALRTER